MYVHTVLPFLFLLYYIYVNIYALVLHVHTIHMYIHNTQVCTYQILIPIGIGEARTVQYGY